MVLVCVVLKMAEMLRCPVCFSYGLSEDCPCGGKRVSPKPAKFSIEDHYGVYRRKAKKLLRGGSS